MCPEQHRRQCRGHADAAERVHAGIVDGQHPGHALARSDHGEAIVERDRDIGRGGERCRQRRRAGRQGMRGVRRGAAVGPGHEVVLCSTQRLGTRRPDLEACIDDDRVRMRRCSGGAVEQQRQAGWNARQCHAGRGWIDVDFFRIAEPAVVGASQHDAQIRRKRCARRDKTRARSSEVAEHAFSATGEIGIRAILAIDLPGKRGIGQYALLRIAAGRGQRDGLVARPQRGGVRAGDRDGRRTVDHGNHHRRHIDAAMAIRNLHGDLVHAIRAIERARGDASRIAEVTVAVEIPRPAQCIQVVRIDAVRRAEADRAWRAVRDRAGIQRDRRGRCDIAGRCRRAAGAVRNS